MKMTKSTNKPLPIKLANLFVEINSTFGHAKELVLDAYNLAIQEKCTPKEARQLLLDNIKVFKKTQIYAYLPTECKDPIKQKAGSVSHRGNVSVQTSEQEVVKVLAEYTSLSASQATKADNNVSKLQSENIILKKEIENISNNVIPEVLLKKERYIEELRKEKEELQHEYEQLANEPQLPKVYERKLQLLGELILPLRVHVYPQTDECMVEIDKEVAREVFTKVCKELG